MKELENRDRTLILSKSNSSRKSFFFIGLILSLWGTGLLFLFMTGSRILVPQVTIPVYIFAICLFVGGIKMMLLSNSYARGNTMFNFYEHLSSNLVNDILSSIAFLNFTIMFIVVGIYVSIGFLFVGGLFFILCMVGLIMGTKEFIRNRKIAKPFWTSKIELRRVPNLITEDTLILGFSNSTPLLEQVPLDFTLRFLKERNVKIQNKRKDETKSKFKTFVHFENKKTIILENGNAVAEFTLPPDESLQNNFDFQEPDYWELEVSEKETGFFTRFVLETIN